jgi:hypothetical protein
MLLEAGSDAYILGGVTQLAKKSTQLVGWAKKASQRRPAVAERSGFAFANPSTPHHEIELSTRGCVWR